MVASKTAILLFSTNVKIKKVSKEIFAKTFKGLGVFFIYNRALSTFQQCRKFQYDDRTLSLKIYYILTLQENNRSAVFEATTNFLPFSVTNQQPRVRLTQTMS